MLERGKKILLISKAIEAAFSTSEWTELGYMTGTDEWIDSHPRLLRSLRWGDPDYRQHVLVAVAHILDGDPQNLRQVVDYDPIASWLKQHDPGGLSQLQAEAHGFDAPDPPPPATSTDAGLAALADAQALLRTRGPTSAVDRVHTGLHAFLRAACDDAGIVYPADPSANQLLKLLLDQHMKLDDLGPRSDEVKRVIRTAGNIVDALGTLRNRASLAHPNVELLDQDEALLVISVARALLRYLDSKVSR